MDRAVKGNKDQEWSLSTSTGAARKVEHPRIVESTDRILNDALSALKFDLYHEAKDEQVITC